MASEKHSKVLGKIAMKLGTAQAILVISDGSITPEDLEDLAIFNISAMGTLALTGPAAFAVGTLTFNWSVIDAYYDSEQDGDSPAG